MIVLMVVTLGVYYLVWWYRRRPGLNRLNSPDKLHLWPLLLLTAQYVIQFAIGLATGEATEEEVLGETGVVLVALFQFLVAVVMIVQAFRIKGMIEDHAARTQSESMFAGQVELSGLMTFFFSIFYLQWAINRYVVPSEG
jgi:hypothetical protein